MDLEYHGGRLFPGVCKLPVGLDWPRSGDGYLERKAEFIRHGVMPLRPGNSGLAHRGPTATSFKQNSQANICSTVKQTLARGDVSGKSP
jgi:hypothetical protein